MAKPNPLAKVSIFRGLSKAELALLQARAARQRFPAGARIISEGEDSDSMFVVLKGAVRVFVSDDEGNEVTVDTMKRGDYFGEYAMLDGSKRSASVATTKESDVLMISKDTIIEMFSENPDTAFSLIADMVSRIRDLTSTVKDLSLMEIQGRVAGALLKASEAEAKQISTGELTSEVGAPADVIEGIMQDLESAGYITRDGNNIIIND